MQPRTRVSTPASLRGARYCVATASSSAPVVIPASTNSTKRGHSRCVRLNPGTAARTWEYASDWIVARVPITPTRPFLVAVTAWRAAGVMTSTTGMPASTQ